MYIAHHEWNFIDDRIKQMRCGTPQSLTENKKNKNVGRAYNNK